MKRKARPSEPTVRDLARSILNALASESPDPFTSTWVRRWVWERWHQGRFTKDQLHATTRAFDLLRRRGFVRVVEQRGTYRRYELSEQAIRWLDWSGFDWKARRAA